MSRIFLSLASLATISMITSLLLGLRIGDFNGTYRQLIDLREEARQAEDYSFERTEADEKMEQRLETQRAQLDEIRPRAATHIMVGMFSALISLLVHSVCVTYFIGTCKWCGEVVSTYQLDTALFARSRQLKRRAFPWSFLGICALLGVTACGAAADPGTLRIGTWNWVEPHLWVATIGIVLNIASFWKQWQYLVQNVQVVDAVQEQVRVIRVQHGLATESLP